VKHADLLGKGFGGINFKPFIKIVSQGLSEFPSVDFTLPMDHKQMEDASLLCYNVFYLVSNENKVRGFPV